MQMMFILVCLLFLLNLGSAGQDICVDSLALEVLETSELGIGNTIQVVAYKVGSVFAGAALLWVNEVTSWPMMWAVFFSLYLLCLLLINNLRLGFTDSATPQEQDFPLSLAAMRDNWGRILEVP